MRYGGKILGVSSLILTSTLLLISTLNRYQSLKTGISFSAVDYFKVVIVDSQSSSQVITNIIYPFAGLFWQNIFLLFPFKLLSNVFSIEASYAISSFFVTATSSLFLYLILRKFLNRIGSLFFLWLFIFTQSSVSFHEFFTSDLRRVSQMGQMSMADFPNPSSLILGLLFFYYFAILSQAPPKSKAIRISLALLLQLFINPINLMICGAWVLSDYFITRQSPRFHLTRKSRLATITLFGVIIFLQVFKLSMTQDRTNESLLGGILNDQPFQLSLYHTIVFILIPALLLIVITKIMNVSWHEIIVRFSFNLLLYISSVVVLLYGVVLNQNSLQEVFLRNGITTVTNILVYMPILSLLIEGRYDKILVAQNSYFAKLVTFSPKLLNLVTFVLFGAVLCQSTFSIINARSISFGLSCQNFNATARLGIENLMTNSYSEMVEEREVQILNYAKDRMTPADFRIFMQNPVTNSKSQVTGKYACAMAGLGYLSLNGFSQSDFSRNRANALILRFITDGKVG